jgi:hypothetical protein
VSANRTAPQKMQRKNILMVLSATIAIGSAMLAWRSHWAIVRATNSARAAEQESQRLATEARRLEEEIGPAMNRQAEGPVALKTPDQLSQEGKSREPDFVLRIPFDDPEMQTHALRTLQSGLGLKYAAFYRALGLDAERIAKFESLLAEYEGRKVDIRTVERTRPVDPALAVPFDAVTVDGRRVQIAMDPSAAKLRRAADADLKQAQIALLGPNGYERLQEFEATAESRTFVGDLVRNLALTAQPLTADQGERLLQALQAGNFQVKIEPEKTEWSAILAQARPALTPAQFDEFQALASAHKLKVVRNEMSHMLQSAK